jgi:predicted enzyme related to lactoylglutathione lyase
MSLIEGIGGVFLFSNDPRRLADWYAECFGIVPARAAEAEAECNAIYRTFEVRDADEPETKREIAWAILGSEHEIAGAPRTGQVNYRVKDLGAVLHALGEKGVHVDKTAEYPYGHFAWLKDCDGNAVELWEPR